MKITGFALVSSLFAFVPGVLYGADSAPLLKQFIETDLARIAASPEIVAAIRERNLVTSAFTADQIAAADQAWKSELGQGEMPTVTPIVTSAASAMLRAEVVASNGLIAEVFVMDAIGLTAAASDPTSDFWQGDEAKFIETFGKGAGSYLIGAVEFDDSTQTYSAQVSAVVLDPDTGAPIGAITSSVNAEFLD